MQRRAALPSRATRRRCRRTLSLISLSTHRYVSATTTSSRPRSSSLSSKRWLHEDSLQRAQCGRLP
eukprot:scaffold5861_cov51-Phaeocystis_antarctica.AAC.1